MTVSQQLPRTAAIAAGFLLVVSACGTQEPTRLAADLTTTTTTTASSAATTTTPPPVTVASIVDGRTAMLSNGTKVVLSGLAQPGECWAAAAVEFATKTLVGKTVQAEASRLLLADGTDFAVLAVGQGVGRAIPGADTAIQVAETAAKRATMGFWGPSCGGLDVKPAPVVAPPVAPQPVAPKPQPAPAPPPPAAAYYANCAAAKAAGAAPLYRGQPGYRAGLDGDGDGKACEK
ncbi:Excalibur calcium-binding domain-containing protein [Lentzea waywayandensis]|uniref:Excalibur calcium-binding domain-containing protein n=1 Tax=Lentzea waywayandensis TaxID=84724 RepID=A0A1I6EX80_9PSEU|nr:excalibur calcium-binding domain-containing protein [Lentzea waywayandensis]SFR22227.1 Excalibur calcium-binding domain-containing protein [Lentzea waywayandensis]